MKRTDQKILKLADMDSTLIFSILSDFFSKFLTKFDYN